MQNLMIFSWLVEVSAIQLVVVYLPEYMGLTWADGSSLVVV